MSAYRYEDIEAKAIGSFAGLFEYGRNTAKAEILVEIAYVRRVKCQEGGE